MNERVQNVNGWRLTAIILIVFLLFGAGSVVGVYFVWRAEAHLMLQQTRNIWTALRAVGIEYYGNDEQMYDKRKPSGLTAEAEEEVKRISGYKGELVVLENEEEELAPTKLFYHEGAYMIYYYLDENDYRQWEVYRAHSLFTLDGSARENFG